MFIIDARILMIADARRIDMLRRVFRPSFMPLATLHSSGVYPLMPPFTHFLRHLLHQNYKLLQSPITYCPCCKTIV